MKIKSSYNATIVLPPNVPVYPDTEVDYPHWDQYKDNPAIAWYVEQGHLTVSESDEEEFEEGEAEDEDEGEAEPEPESESDPEVVEDVQLTEQEPESAADEVAEEPAAELSEDEQKESLISQLAQLGVKADKRSSVEKLQEKLEEALAK